MREFTWEFTSAKRLQKHFLCDQSSSWCAGCAHRIRLERKRARGIPKRTLKLRNALQTEQVVSMLCPIPKDTILVFLINYSHYLHLSNITIVLECTFGGARCSQGVDLESGPLRAVHLSRHNHRPWSRKGHLLSSQISSESCYNSTHFDIQVHYTARSLSSFTGKLGDK